MKLKLFMYLTLIHAGLITVVSETEIDLELKGCRLFGESEFFNSTTILAIEESDVELGFACNATHMPITEEFSCQRFCKDALIFEENFDTLDRKKWQREIRTPMNMPIDGGAFVSYQNRSENCYFNNGELHIAPTLLADIPGFDESAIRTGTLDLTSDCTGTQPMECYRKAQYCHILPPIVSARIRTKGSFEFRYGRVEVRASVPTADWVIPLILLEPTENFYGDNFVQLRIIPPLDRARGFHVYTVEWTDKYIAYSKDGWEYTRVYSGLTNQSKKVPHSEFGQTVKNKSPTDRKFFITLGLSVGGHTEFPDSDNKPWKNMEPKAAVQFWNERNQWLKSFRQDQAELIVDYVRVYAL